MLDPSRLSFSARRHGANLGICLPIMPSLLDVAIGFELLFT